MSLSLFQFANQLNVNQRYLVVEVAENVKIFKKKVTYE